MNISSRTNLHTLWDSGIINYRMAQDFNSSFDLYYNHIFNIMNNEIPAMNDNDIEQWIREDLNFVCQQIYLDDNNSIMNSSIIFRLNEIYYRRSIGIIEQRLAQGGRRLGALFNRLGQNRPIKLTKEKICLGTWISTAILITELIIGIVLGIIFFIRYKTKNSR
jgi:hypothetical protein